MNAEHSFLVIVINYLEGVTVILSNIQREI